MVKVLVLPDYNPPQNGEIPSIIIDQICNYIIKFNDLINFSLINKETYNHIMNNNKLWIRYLRKLNIWDEQSKDKKIGENELNPINCFDFKINDKEISRIYFIKIYSILYPILNEILINNYSNFQNLSILNKFNTPLKQSKLFSNIGNFLLLFKDFENYNNLIIRFNSILNLFLNSLIFEINIQLNNSNYPVVLNLINSLDYLNISNDDLKIDPLESLLEFFITKYNDDYLYLSSDDLVDKCFIKEKNLKNNKKRGIVKGYSFNFQKIDEIFQNVEILLNNQLNEINLIFNSNSDNNNDNDKIKNDRDIDEIPIVLKIIENFLSNHLIGGLSDRIISRARQIDISDDLSDKDNKLEEEIKIDNEINQDDNRINIMNEESLFFQCVPYLHYSLISTLQRLKYPNTEILSNLNETNKYIKMDYIKIVCEFVNYYYEQYLIEFTNELPRQCYKSLIQLIKLWQSKNEKIQKNMEFEILKLVDENEDNNKKFNFEIFNTFSNLFSFKSKQEEDKADIEIKDKDDDDNDDSNQIKLTKMAAKLKILTNKVESMKSLVSLDLTVLLLQHIKNSYDLLLGLTKYSTTEQLNKQIYSTCINIFNDMLNLLINNHIKPGFNEAIKRLKVYNPIDNNNNDDNDNNLILEPVNKFIELVDVGDLILQMINIFYNNELIKNGIILNNNNIKQSKDFIKMNNIEKSIKLLEFTLDNYVANGLDISINIIINEIKMKIEDNIGKLPINSNNNNNINNINSSSKENKKFNEDNENQNDYVYDLNKIEKLPLNEGNNCKWCEICLKVLKSHFNLLKDSIDKSIMEVFKQELGDRLITLIIQLLLIKFKISNIGGIQFSYDINSLYDYYKINKIKPAIEYLIGFKKIDQLYLIDCSSLNSKEFKSQCKELGKLIIEIGRDNGIFTPEEVYQFVSRRSDWIKIKKYIDKVVYGFGAEDCLIS